MSRQEIFVKLQKLANWLSRTRLIQGFFDFVMFYGAFKVVMSGTTVTILGRTFPQSTAMMMVILLSIADVSFAAIRRNYRREGVRLIQKINGRLTDDEAKIVRQFQK